MTPWEHVREAERLAAKADAEDAPEWVVAWSHLALLHVEMAKAKDLMERPGPVAPKVRTVGRVYPLDTP